MAKVVQLNPHATAEGLLEYAKSWGFADLVVLGYNSEGELVCGATEDLSQADVHFMAAQLQKMMLEPDDEEEEC